jgi:hydrogenase maturation protein HypF
VKAISLHVTGIVQGVGFRPFVYNLATSQGLTGWVLNASDGVHAYVEGNKDTINAFPEALRLSAPPMSLIEGMAVSAVDVEGLTGFEIRESRVAEGTMTLVSPDIATCPQCLAELGDPRDRRHGYPFINCTNCGPRFTIISGVPYDRPATSMAGFQMCPECAAEYDDPADRRFHAQPDACFICGPRVYLTPSPSAEEPVWVEDLGDFDRDWAWTRERASAPKAHRDRPAERARSQTIIEAAAVMLRAGRILAIKGLGGYQLACDATSEAAVASLRERKHRWGKPLAVMVRDLEAAKRIAEIGPEEASLLSGTVRPIVLACRERDDGLAPGVADNLREIGVMLPYTPLHHLLLAEMGDRPLVMTSGNLSDEPIATGDAEALARLGGIADAFLSHDREILSRYDDSVVRVVDGETQLIRRARGYAPYPLKLPFASDTGILAVGPEQKNTFTLITGEHAFVSQHIGDMENAETLAAFEETLALYERLFSVQPEVIAHDLHPEYLSTKWALAQPQPKIGVQHHHAHIVSVTAEHGMSERVIGVAFDGTGYGEDGRIWGGEILLADWASYERFARLAYVPMPGGSGAIKRPARMAIGTLTAHRLLEHPGAAPLRSRLAPGEEALLSKMIAGGVNCPLTSSMGRLFDAVAALIGIADDARYEGEAAILLEAAADLSAEGSYGFGFDARRADPDSSGPDSPSGNPADDPLVIDPTPVLSAILDDLAAQTPAGTISARFHRAVVQCIVVVCEAAALETGIQHVALCGGVFMNRIVLGQAARQLRDAGLTPLTHVRLPANDGAVSLGQAVVAWARRHGI